MGKVMKCVFLLVTAMAGAWAGVAQTSAFEVASVKRNLSDNPSGGSISRPEGGRFQASNVTLRTLIRTAYDVENFQIVSGAVKWLDDEKFDVNAKAEGNASWLQTRIMLQDLLANRFRLSLSRERRTIHAYAMRIAKTGPKLMPPTDPACEPPPLGACGGIRIVNRRILYGVNVSTAELARVLTTFLGRPVFDQTLLVGVFDFKMDWVLDMGGFGEANPDDAAAQPAGPSIFTALQEQLGLRLTSQNSLVETLVISHAEEPGPN